MSDPEKAKMRLQKEFYKSAIAQRKDFTRGPITIKDLGLAEDVDKLAASPASQAARKTAKAEADAALNKAKVKAEAATAGARGPEPEPQSEPEPQPNQRTPSANADEQLRVNLAKANSIVSAAEEEKVRGVTSTQADGGAPPRRRLGRRVMSSKKRARRQRTARKGSGRRSSGIAQKRTARKRTTGRSSRPG